MQDEDVERIVAAKERSGDIHYPAFVKPMKVGYCIAKKDLPRQGDNSLGITGRSICNNQRELVVYLVELIHQYGFNEFIIQEYLTGTEYSVGVIGNPESGFHFLPILQVDYSKIVEQGLQPILGWESKWDPDSPYWTGVDYVVAKKIPRSKRAAKSKMEETKPSQFSSTEELKPALLTGGLTEEEEQELKRSCTILFERFGCRDYARFDWRADREVQYNPATGQMRAFTLTSRPTSNAPGFDDVASEQDADHDDNLSAISDSSSSANGAVGSDSGRGSSRDSDGLSEQSRHGSSRRLRAIKLLEVNPNPGWCWDGKFAKMAHGTGIEYHDMIKSILWASWVRVYGTENMAKVVATLRDPQAASDALSALAAAPPLTN